MLTSSNMTHSLSLRACVRDKNSTLCLELAHVSGSKDIYRPLVKQKKNISEVLRPPNSKVRGLMTHHCQWLFTTGLGC